eukprot:5472272-Alexandrium_andersonii.AAC.1
MAGCDGRDQRRPGRPLAGGVHEREVPPRHHLPGLEVRLCCGPPGQADGQRLGGAGRPPPRPAQ